MEELAERIDELVDDDDRIITYKSVSFDLALPINQSKELLEYYYKTKKSNKLNAIYLLSGITESGVEFRLAHNKKLVEEKLSFIKLLSCHIYSLQKITLNSSSVLYNVDYDKTKNALENGISYSPLKYDGSKKMTSDEVEAFKQLMMKNKPEEDCLKNSFGASSTSKSKKKASGISLFTSKLPKTNDKQITSKNTESDDNKNVSESNDEKDVSHEKPLIDKNGKKTKVSKSSSMMMFMKKSQSSSSAEKTMKKKIKKEVITSSPTKQTSEETENFHEDFLDTVLNKKQKSPQKNKSKEKIVMKDESAKEKRPKKVLKNKTSLKKVEEVDDEVGSTKENIVVDDQKKRSKKKSVKQEPKIKKRRVFMESESSSDEDLSDKEEIVIPATPIKQAEKSICIKVGSKNKKKVLKSRTYIDDDGSMLTKKEWEEVSCSSDENDTKAVEKTNIVTSVEINKPKKQFSKINQKQSSLRNFFAKKSS